MDDETRLALLQYKNEIEELAAETMALQAIIVYLSRRICAASADLRPIILQAFDEAASFTENLSLARRKASGHMPRALKVIEELRGQVAGKSQPKDLV